MECGRSVHEVSLEPAQLGRIDLTEMKPKPAVQRSAKGPISIDECSPDGKYIQLVNNSVNKDVDMTGWRLLRTVDNAPELSFVIPSNFKLTNRKTVRIYAHDQGDKRAPFDFVSSNFDSWGVGLNAITRLLNNDNEEKACHIQKTVN